MAKRCPGRFPILLGVAIGFIAAAPLSSAVAAEAGAKYFAINASRLPTADLPPDATVSTEDTPIAVAFARFSAGAATIDLGFDWQHTRYEFEGIDSRNRDLHRVQFPIWIAAPMGKWQLQSVVAPSIFTSSNVLGDFFNRGSSDDLAVTARVELRGSSAHRPWVIGVAHDRSLGKSETYPVLGFAYEAGDDLALRLTWPDPGLRVRLAERQYGSFRLFPAGSQWHVRTDDFTREFDYRFEAWRSQFNWNVGFANNLSLDLSLGYEFGRSPHFTDRLGARINRDADDQWLFAVGFRWGDAPLPLTHGAHLNR